MSDFPNGEWINKWGACRVCGGEIPYGHTENCDHYKLERENNQLRQQLAGAVKDKERLDWLDLAGQNTQNHITLDWGSEINVRQAIDAAIEAQKGNV